MAQQPRTTSPYLASSRFRPRSSDPYNPDFGGCQRSLFWVARIRTRPLPQIWCHSREPWHLLQCRKSWRLSLRRCLWNPKRSRQNLEILEKVEEVFEFANKPSRIRGPGADVVDSGRLLTAVLVVNKQKNENILENQDGWERRNRARVEENLGRRSERCVRRFDIANNK